MLSRVDKRSLIYSWCRVLSTLGVKANRGNSVIGVIPQSTSLERRERATSCNTPSTNCDYSTATPVLTTSTSLLCGPDEHAPKSVYEFLQAAKS